MEYFTKTELSGALRAIASTIAKCEKVQPKLKEGTPQYTLLIRRIKALRIALVLIERELAEMEKRADDESKGCNNFIGSELAGNTGAEQATGPDSQGDYHKTG